MEKPVKWRLKNEKSKILYNFKIKFVYLKIKIIIYFIINV